MLNQASQPPNMKLGESEPNQIDLVSWSAFVLAL